MHSNDFLHRDLKPENILVTKDEVLKISDFGNSKLLTPEQRIAHTYGGTFSFMANEIMTSKPHGKSADMWSLGVMVYYICTGDYYFNGDLITTAVRMNLRPQVGEDYSPLMQNFVDCLL